MFAKKDGNEKLVADVGEVTTTGGKTQQAEMKKLPHKNGPFRIVSELVNCLKQRILDVIYVGTGNMQAMSVKVIYIWKKDHKSAAEWLHADSIYQNNVKALV